MRRVWLLALLALAGLAAVPGTATAAIGDEEELWRTPGVGTDAGELGFPFRVASDPSTGHVLVVERASNRVSEFTPWGGFVKAFGFDVAPGAANEQQEVRVRAAEGQFKLSFGADTTTDLPFSASGTEVQAALNALSSISGGGGSVSVEARLGNANGTTPFIYVVAFKGSLAGTDVAPLVAANGSTPLGGGTPSTDLLVRTRADGHGSTTGLESCTAESGCKAGIAGAGAGQLADARGVAVDAAGNIYVREVGNLRVQKFDSAGRFLLMFGGKVNKTTSANRCTKADLEGGDVCGIGVEGSGPGEFGASSSSGIALDAVGKLFVGDVERIQRFNLEGEWELSVPVSETVHDLAVAPGSGDFYATVGSPNTTELNVRILNGATGAEEGKLQAKELVNSEGKAIEGTKTTGGPLATDPAGNVFARRGSLSLGEGEPPASPLLQFDAAGNQLSEFGRALPGAVSGLGTNAIGDLHVASGSAGQITAFGPGPVDFESPPKRPPEITGQFAISVQRDSATVAAEINPRFFSSTTYYVQYGTSPCTEGGCTQLKPVPPGAELTKKTANAPLRAAGIFLEGLTPGTTYHYRFIAESGGGGPVYGIDPDGEGGEEASPAKGLEATFITPDPIAPKACANDVFRGGAAARLPNCRAYEMVSPVDKNNGDIKTLVNLQGYATSFIQSAEDGNRLTYSSYRAFADPKGAPFSDQLLATRGPDAWSSEAIDPPQGPAASTNINILGNNFKDFSEDLCLGWVVVAAEPQLDPPRDAVDYPNVYRRQNCGPDKESYEALVPVKPTIPQELFYPEPQGASADGEATVFRINDWLADGAVVNCVTAISPATETASYRWLRNGAPIASATSSTYTPGEADQGSALQCEVTVHKGELGSTQVATPPIAALLGPGATPPVAPTDIPAPSANEPLSVGGPGGQTLSCDPNEAGWNGSPTFSYRWYRNGTEIGGASASTYLVSAPDLASAAVFQCAVTGANADGSVVKVSANLYTAPAPPSPPVASASMQSPWQTYYASDGDLKLLCVLPSGLSSGGNCSAGTGGESTTGLCQPVLGRMSNVTNAISADGKRVYWTDSATQETGAGKIYLRINPGATPGAGGACETGKACTVKVSEPSTTRDSRFLVASPNGAKALFEVTEGPAIGDLYEFNAGGAARKIAGDTLGVAGASEDLSRIYFVSEEALEGDAEPEEPNLYLEEGEEATFIATLSDTDAVIPSALEEAIPSVTARKPIYHAAQASKDGGALAFISNADLTDYDNTDLANGRADSEVYLYEAGAQGPVCVSCNPSRARPAGRVVRLNRDADNLPIAATLTLPTSMLHTPRALSAAGARLVFNSFDPLLPRDTNGAADLYMWERAPDKATCVGLGAELYVATAAGCISLISSGQSPEDSEFVDASPNGNDVFFITNASLLSQDPGLFDVYDARVGGGLPGPFIPPPDCQGETCKPPATAPNDPTPASSAYVGPGDLNEKAKKKNKKNKNKKAKKKNKGKGKNKGKKQSQKGRAGK